MRRVLRFLREHALLPAGDTIVVGVSGGPDSVCLLHLLSRLQDRLAVSLHIAHLNHLLRGAESDADAQYVSSLASSMGISATVASRDVRAYQMALRCSLEEAAREVRYAFFAEVAREVGASRVAVGHTADDQVETILLHLIRGTGIAGLRGMQPATSWRSTATGASLLLVRPLLEVSREETAEYCSRHGLSPRQDLSNLSPSLLRNRMRTELIPLLRTFNPNIRETLFRVARLASDDLALIEEQAACHWESVAKAADDSVSLDTKALLALPVALQRYILRAAVEHILGNLRDFEAIHIEDMIGVMKKPVGSTVSLPHALVFTAGYGTCTLSRVSKGEAARLEGEHRLVIPGETMLPGWRVVAQVTDSLPADFILGGHKACFDLEVVGSELTVRGRRPGDRFQPLGMPQPKKLQDFMVDAKIPRGDRDSVPLVCSREHIIWVVGWRVDERVRLLPGTCRYLCLEFRPSVT